MRTTIFVLCATAWLRADAVLLSNGERIDCQILGGTANTLQIRRSDGNGRTYVQKLDRANIDRIERDPASRPAEATRSPKTQPARPAPATASAPVAVLSPDDLPVDTKKGLIVAVAKWRAEDFTGAGMDLAKLINTAKPDEREAMSTMARGLTQKTLAELAADTHFRAALASRRGSAVRLPYVTEYEKQALIPLIVAAYDQTLRERDKASVNPPPAPAADPSRKPRSNDPATTRPAQNSGSAKQQPWYAAYAQTRPAAAPVQPGDPPALIDWLDRPQAFDGTVEEAQSLLSRIHQGMSLLNERLRLDPALRRNADLKRELLADKQRLVALRKTLEAYSPEQPDEAPEPPTLTEAQKARREEMEKRMEEARKAEAKRMQEAREAAIKWQQDQENKNKKGLFDWLKPAPQNQPTPPVPTPAPTQQPAVSPK